MLLFDCSSIQPKLSSSCLAHVAISLNYRMNAVPWLSVHRLFIMLMLYEILASCWTVRCPCSDTSARLPAYASITFGGCIRSEIMSVKQSWLNFCDVTCHHSHQLLQLHPRWPSCFTLAPLQWVQNAAARLVLNLDRRSHISPALQQLHWLPVKYCVTDKIATLMHQFYTTAVHRTLST